ncbi:hypothetical protein KDL01_12905 [Actinospica durhamensis]|uniref:Uncharacterized protein n=1 Tax=Actinospica durhamensis TaxID=1508375 RepID=A0A941EM26_9ACTN|nr:hypothetical protein [Actinospica durhamensis]MBR7834167.1 hypothetical protein [Actinospica durhamensis]
MAALEVILNPGRWGRQFAFEATWGPSWQRASMLNGAGDEYSIVFTPDGAWAFGFDHESEMSPYRCDPLALWPGLLDGMPEAFRALVDEPAFCDPDGPTMRATVCFWRERGAAGWACGAPMAPTRPGEDGGAGWLFEVLCGGAEGYGAFARDNYRAEIDVEAVQQVYGLKQLTPEVIARLNPGADVSVLADGLGAIGLEVRG